MTGWTRCDVALPPVTDNEWWRLESAYVLIRTQPTRGYPKGEPHIASYFTHRDPDDGAPGWRLQGRDGYTLEADEVMDWMEIPE